MSGLYLISPAKIEDNFYPLLSDTLASKKVAIFQLRLKDIEYSDLLAKSQLVKEICDNHSVEFIINDNAKIAHQLACGLHIGSGDFASYAELLELKNLLKTINPQARIGVSCYDKLELAHQAISAGIDIVSFGSFFVSKTKVSPYRPDFEIILKCREFITNKESNCKIAVIGGINDSNVKYFNSYLPDYICISGAIWSAESPLNMCLKISEYINKISRNLR